MSKSTGTTLIAVGLAAVVAAQSAVTGAQTKAAPDASGVNVTVKYTGTGTVDANHKIWVWLFNTPDIGPGAMPISEQSIEQNGGSASFPNLSATEVWAAIAYDERGGFAGSAPPPAGAPVTLYGVKTPTDKPQPIVPGPKGSVTVILTDAQRMP